MITEAIKILSSGKDLAASQMGAVMEEIMSGKALDSDIVSFLTALSDKGETAEELTAAVTIMRLHVSRVNICNRVVLDTCGTGGDAKGTFNISTATAFVASGCGITVAKHGNRSVSSKSGSADVLEALGVDINMPPERIEECLEAIGVAFLFAQNLHPAMKYAMPARKQIGKRTMFNILGPLSNPAGATHQLIGVYDKRWAEVLANVLRNLGTVHALVVHGEDGLDEITTTAATFIAETYKDNVKTYEINPEDFGIKRAGLDDIRGGSAVDNAKILTDVLNGKPGAYRDIVVLNAAAAIYAADKVVSIKEGIGLAQESIDSKKALKKLELLREFSQRI
ncbi:MAG: anthranilate phosphoribosyltransferase [Candidatus Omnitrophota bacterium]